MKNESFKKSFGLITASPSEIETANHRNLPLLLAENFPKMLDNTSIGEVNLGDPILIKAIESLLIRLAAPPMTK
jgi:hypothetical protein